MKKLQHILALSLLFCFTLVSAQVETSSPTNISIKGKITDQVTGEAILFGSVALYKDNILLKGMESDLDGNYHFYLEEFGNYQIEVSYVGYQTQRIDEIEVTAEKVYIVDVAITEGVQLQTCVIVDFKEPLVDYSNTSSNHTVTAEQIKNLPTKNINAIQAATAGLSRIKQRRKNNTCDPALNTEEYSHIEENKFINPLDEALSTFSIDVDRASYSNVRRFINQGNMPPADAVRIEEMINYFPYEYEIPSTELPFKINHQLTECPWNPENQILHIGIQGVKIEKEELPPTNLVFLVDVSGSMSWDNKLALVKKSLNLLVDNMREEDKIALVVYAGSAGLVLNSTPGNEKLIIKEAINNLSAGGSTAGGAGIQLAYKIAKENFIIEGNNRVILATDGDFNIGISDEGSLVKMIEKKREEDIFLSVLGYGMGNYKDSKMQILADTGNGNHAYIDNLQEAKKTLIDEFGGTLFTIAKDVKIQIEFNPEFVESYKLIGYENRLLNKEEFYDDTKDAGELGAGHTVTAFYEIVPASSKKMATKDVDNLIYQKHETIQNKDDLATIKLRYKKPTGKRSKLILETISPKIEEQVSSDVHFALCVAEFGMLLRNLTAVEDRTFEGLLLRTRNHLGSDEYGYRDEFAGLIEKVIDLSQKI